MNCPDGFTEAEVTKIIDDVTKALAPSFVFGFHTVKDIQQEAWIFAIDGLERFKNDGKNSLYNFLYTHVHNRLFNLKRNTFSRRLPPCSTCDDASCPRCLKRRIKTNTKRNLVQTESLSNKPSHNLIDQELHFTDEIASREIVSKIEERLPADYRADYHRLLQKIKITKTRKAKLKEMILEIIRELEGD